MTDWLTDSGVRIRTRIQIPDPDQIHLCGSQRSLSALVGFVFIPAPLLTCDATSTCHVFPIFWFPLYLTSMFQLHVVAVQSIKSFFCHFCSSYSYIFHLNSSTNPQQIWWQRLCCCMASFVEEFAEKSAADLYSYGQFRRYPKNHLFGFWEITAQCDVWFSALYKYSYLLTY